MKKTSIVALFIALVAQFASADTKLDVAGSEYFATRTFDAGPTYIYGTNGLVVTKRDSSGNETNGFDVDTINGDTYRVNRIWATSTEALIFIEIRDYTNGVFYIYRSTDHGATEPTRVIELGCTDCSASAVDGSTQTSNISTLQRGFCEYSSSRFFVGEYLLSASAGPEQRIWERIDGGATFVELVKFNPADTGDGNPQIRHIHCILKDPYSSNVYIGTGDTDAESGIIVWDGSSDLSDNSYSDFVQRNAQKWRLTDFLFTSDYVFWAADADSEAASQNIYRADRDGLLSNPIAVKSISPRWGGYGLKTLNGELILGDAHNPQTTINGTHDGGDNQASFTDSGQQWEKNQWNGFTVLNTTDGSSGRITANTPTSITSTLSGGTDNDWDDGDVSAIVDSHKHFYLSDDDGENWHKVASVVEENDSTSTRIRNIYEFGGKVHISQYSPAGKDADNTIVCEAIGDFNRDHPLVLNPVYWVNESSGNDGNSGYTSDAAKASLENILDDDADQITMGARVIVQTDTTGEDSIDADWDGNSRAGTGFVTIDGGFGAKKKVVMKNSAAGGYFFYPRNEEPIRFQNIWVDTVETGAHDLFAMQSGANVEMYDCEIGNTNGSYAVTETIRFQGRLKAKRIKINHPGGDDVIYSDGSGYIEMQNFIFNGGGRAVDLRHASIDAIFRYGSIYNVTTHGIRTEGSADTVPSIKNVAFDMPSGNSIRDDASLTESDSDIDYNCFDAVTGNLTNSGGANSINADPQFADPSSDNFFVKRSSPAIGAGAGGSTIGAKGPMPGTLMIGF